MARQITLGEMRAATLKGEVVVGAQVAAWNLASPPPEMDWIEADDLAQLCRDIAAKPVDAPQGIRIHRVRVADVNLDWLSLPCQLWLHECDLGSRFSMRDAKVAMLGLNGSRVAGEINLLRARIDRNLFLRGVHASTTDLMAVTVGGNIVASDLILNAGESESAIKADDAAISGNLVLNNARVRGEVGLVGVKIGDSIEVTGCELRAVGTGNAFSADRAEIGGNLFLTNAKVEGQVRLLGAKIGGDVAARSALLEAGESGVSLLAQSSDVRGSLFFDKAKLAGIIDLHSAKIGGTLEITNLESTKIDDTSKTNDLKQPESRSFELLETRVNLILDDPACWSGHNYDLRGFRYRLGGDQTWSVDERIAWVEGASAASRTSPMPYRQLARAYHADGDEAAARRVEYARLEMLRRRPNQGRFLPMLLWLSRTFVGHGVHPQRGLYWLAGAIFFTTMAFWAAERLGSMTPSQPVVYATPYYLADGTPREDHAPAPRSHMDYRMREQPFLSSFLYAVDLLIPIDLGVANAWTISPRGSDPPKGLHRLLGVEGQCQRRPEHPRSSPDGGWCDSLFIYEMFGTYWYDYWLLLLQWFYVIAGHLLLAATLLAFTGWLNPDRSRDGD